MVLGGITLLSDQKRGRSRALCVTAMLQLSPAGWGCKTLFLLLNHVLLLVDMKFVSVKHVLLLFLDMIFFLFLNMCYSLTPSSSSILLDVC